jgi:Fe2+ transport system protein FeoA
MSEMESPSSRRRRGLLLLADAQEGKNYLVSGIYERDRRLLEFLEARGIRPGARVQVSGTNYDQTMALVTEAGQVSLGNSAAGKVWVKPAKGNASSPLS